MRSKTRATRRLQDARIGSRVASIRKERHLRLADVAAELGLTETELTEREVGKSSFLAPEVVALASFLGVPPGEFFRHLVIDVTDDPFPGEAEQ